MILYTIHYVLYAIYTIYLYTRYWILYTIIIYYHIDLNRLEWTRIE